MEVWKTHARALVIVLLSCVMPLSAYAAIMLTGTRVVYPEGSREVNVRLSNVDNAPVLVQAWIDEGDAAASPNEIKVPFLLMPPVFRVEPRKEQTLRIMWTGDEMPGDRESVYWLNVLEIPPQPSNADRKNLLQIAFRTRIKLFYRPRALEKEPIAAYSGLKWRLVRVGNQSVVRVENPSPYYISFGKIGIQTAGKRTIELKPDMVAPFGTHDFVQDKGAVHFNGPVEIRYGILNDYGAAVNNTATVE